MKAPGCVALAKAELSLANRKLHHDDPSLFCTSQWQSSSGRGAWAYLAYRWLVSAYLVSGIVYDFAGQLRKGKCVTSQAWCKAKWPIYLTNWNFLVLTLQALMATFLVTRHHFRPHTSSGPMRLSHKVYWTLYNISVGLSPLVSILYWGVVHNPAIHFVDFTNIREHVTNVVITLVELLVCAHPVRLLHLYQPVALGLCYSAFTAVYFAFRGTNRLGFGYVYSILDWQRPDRAALVTLFTLLFELLLFFLVWTVYLLRCRLAKHCQPQTRANIDTKENV